MGATCCWAISDVICDACIRPLGASSEGEQAAAKAAAVASPKAATSSVRRRRQSAEVATKQAQLDAPAPRTTLATIFSGRRLTPEQNALVSGCVSLTTVVVGCAWVATSSEGVLGSGSILEAGSRGASLSAALGGCFHFASYLLTLCAFASASSTVITPLMQLSAVWMLPFSMMAASLGMSTLIRPIHLLSVVLIGAGGFLPAAEGCLSEIATKRFWQQAAVRYVVMGELLICCYNLILHQATYFSGEDGDLAPADGGAGAIIRFFLISRAANGLTCATLFGAVPRLREHAKAMRDVDPRFLLVSVAGEVLSVSGVALVTFSYSSFYEPSVVNAAEGGLQQLFNLLFAVLSHRVFGWGKDVDQISTKCISFLLVALGLTLSTA